MHLRGCLVVCLLFNVFSLKNPSDKTFSQKDKILSPKNKTISSKNQSSSELLVESLKRDPLSFVEVFAQADPNKVNEIIVLLETLAAAALSNKADLVSKKESADNIFSIAQDNVDLANQDKFDSAEAISTLETDLQTVKDDLQTARDVDVAAEEAQRTAVSVRNEAQVAKEAADSNLAEHSSGLDDEYDVIQEVIQMLKDLICPDGYTSKKDTDDIKACYKYVDSKVTWFAARDACAADGADLVTAKDSNFDIIVSITQGASHWIGANDNDNEGRWVWSDGTSVTETHWNINEPNDRGGEDCAHSIGGFPVNKWWNDLPCNVPLGYLCQK